MIPYFVTVNCIECILEDDMPLECHHCQFIQNWHLHSVSSSLLSGGVVDIALIESDAEGIGGSGFVECLREHIHSVSCLFHNVIVLWCSVSIIYNFFILFHQSGYKVEFYCK